jgi:tetratricopeptide (TPR) repeat protein
LRRYEEAIAAFDRALEVAPDLAAADLQRAMSFVLWQGRLDSLSALLKRSSEGYAETGTALMWEARLALWERSPDTLLTILGVADTVTLQSQNSYEPASLYAAWAHQLRGDRSAAQAALVSALTQVNAALRRLSDDWRLHASRGLCLAGLGRESEAMKEAGWLMRSRAYRDHFDGRPYISESRAVIFAQLGRAQEAVAELDSLLAGPSWTNTRLIRLDPRYDPIRADPRFQALLVKYANPQPVH